MSDKPVGAGLLLMFCGTGASSGNRVNIKTKSLLAKDADQDVKLVINCDRMNTICRSSLESTWIVDGCS